MIFVRVNDNDEVIYINNVPFDPINGIGKNKEDIKLSYDEFLVEPIDVPKTSGLEIAVLKIDREKNELYYEIKIREKTKEEIEIEIYDSMKTDLAQISYVLMMNGLI